MDAIELLTTDHNEVRALFAQFRTAHEQDDTDTMKQVAETCMRELDIHTAIEEEIFYPRIQQADSELGEDVAEAVEEHHVVDVLMTEMREIQTASDQWVAKFQVLMENVEHHAEEEETEMFPEVREALGEDKLMTLGEELLTRKQQLQTEFQSRDELYEKAKVLDITGRSSMTKKQLAEAVASAEA